MRKVRTYKIFAMFLMVCMLVQNVQYVKAEPTESTDSGEENYEEEIPAAEVLKDVQEAGEALQDIVAKRPVTALIYLCDFYELRAEPDAQSDVMCSLLSGQGVDILDVAEDEEQNIWFKVCYTEENEEIQGYIRRDFLAYSDERMIDWESQYVESVYSFMSLGFGVYQDVDQFPISYQNALMELKDMHPNWIFVKMDTNLDWNQVVKAENEFGRNLIHNSLALDTWKDGMYDSSWANASQGILKYYLDPRNFLEEDTVFQFEQQTYNPSYHTQAAIQGILDNTFMKGKIEGEELTYAQAFEAVGKETCVSPFLLAGRVRQEQGTGGTSPLISGTYKGYEGLYNYYNIGASGQGNQNVIENGLKRAQQEGWTTRLLSLQGGAKFLVSNYIYYGQDTLYLQKFDVEAAHKGLFWHQYMQNVQAPTSEARTTYQAYEKCDVLDNAFVFRIPVYRNMPEAACTKPAQTDKITLSTGTIENLPVGKTAVLTAFVNGAQASGVEFTFTSSEETVATVDTAGVITALTPGETTISCTKENGTTATCAVKVIKADTVSYEIPVLEPVTYEPTLKLGDIELPEGWKWVNEELVPLAGQTGYSASYTPDESRYNAVTVTVPLTVKKAIPVYTAPTGLKGSYGAELRSVSLPTGFVWEEPALTFEKLGNNTYKASFNPDVFNYETITGIALTVTVSCINHNYGEWQITEPAGCLEAGSHERACKICKKYRK